MITRQTPPPVLSAWRPIMAKRARLNATGGGALRPREMATRSRQLLLKTGGFLEQPLEKVLTHVLGG